ncbi:MAG: polysaccharide biosynthesis/export family protein [Apibacter sp.]|uniref:Polysaccharide export outer membrane protein n=1 Tax=Apibacter mensalis TaxID=1586267 RepID=A0A0X3AMB5_9FLAO|nr:polysaccharide biosynthesis/export family protein [Apibacter mensalis]MCO6564926.1 polysaccharide biosynthesis/export family protein [Apibacter sp.]CVK15531.1 polysaccharide export outer membrane protein [Apibacter mensalis]
MKKTSSFIVPLIILFFIFSLLSCASKKNLYYFQGNETVLNEVYKYTPTLKPDDLLIITISALDMESTLPFNQQSPYNVSSSGSESITSTNPRLKTYLIDENGEIDFPVLGKLKLGGLTRSQAMDFMKDKLRVYIKDPSVNIHISNFRITVLGEVAKPGTYTLSNEKITILEALGLAGDLTIYGKRKDIMVIRDKDGDKTFTHVDLTTNDIFKSPVYYLSQNDIIYVHPNGAKTNSSAYSATNSIFISLAGIILSVISIITR